MIPGDGCDPRSGSHSETDIDVVLSDVLMDEGVGESGQLGSSDLNEGLGLRSIADQLDHSLSGVGGRIHPFTPTRTSANRPGDAECPVCATCIG